MADLNSVEAINLLKAGLHLQIAQTELCSKNKQDFIPSTWIQCDLKYQPHNPFVTHPSEAVVIIPIERFTSIPASNLQRKVRPAPECLLSGICATSSISASGMVDNGKVEMNLHQALEFCSS